MLRAWLLLAVLGFAPTATAQTLSFAETLTRAEEGPVVQARAAALESAQRQIGPAGALPDPQLLLAVENVPATGPDRLRLDRDDMTMRRVGVMQEMPSIAERSARRVVARAVTDQAGAELGAGRLDARLGAAEAWIGLYFAERRARVAETLQQEASAMVRAARARLASGSGSVEDAIAAEIEAARADDRVANTAASVLSMRSELRRWIGDAAAMPLAQEAPQFRIDPTILRERVAQHPRLVVADAATDLADAELRMARSGRWPDWSWELSYGRRDPALEDMASLEVRIGLPVFQPWRQGPLIEAQRAGVTRAQADREAMFREVAATLDGSLARLQALTQAAQRARDVRVPLTRRRADAATGAFASGGLTAAQAIQARREMFEAQIELIDLEEELAIVSADLALQFGDQDQ